MAIPPFSPSLFPSSHFYLFTNLKKVPRYDAILLLLISSVHKGQDLERIRHRYPHFREYAVFLLRGKSEEARGNVKTNNKLNSIISWE